MENFRMWNKKCSFGSEIRLHQKIYYLIEIRKMCSLFFAQHDGMGFLEHNAHIFFDHQQKCIQSEVVAVEHTLFHCCKCRRLKNGCVRETEIDAKHRMFVPPEPS